MPDLTIPAGTYGAAARSRPASACRLWQRGREILVEPTKAPQSAAENPPGSLLCDLPLRTPQVEVRWREGSERTLKLDMGEGASRTLAPSFGTGEVQTISLATDLASAEVELASHPHWADRFWRDGNGLWVETKVRGFEWQEEPSPFEILEAEARMMPQGRSRDDLFASLAGISRTPRVTVTPTDMSTRMLWPTWASRLEKDEHGLFAELVLAENVVTKLRWIPPGRFLIGSPEDETGRWEDEGPQHWVTLTKWYWLADAPCTQAEWEAVMGDSPSLFKGLDRPVEQVGWEDCQQYCEKLRARFPGLEARLPTEAEWEYACRAGTASAYNDGSFCTQPEGKDPALSKLGWFDKNSGDGIHPVRKLVPNQFGLFDMHGNVLEWCEDGWGDYASDEQTDPLRAGKGHEWVVRGGSWVYQARGCRSAFRRWWHPSGRSRYLGFRLASGQSSPVEQASDERAAGKPGGTEARGDRQRATGRKKKEG